MKGNSRNAEAFAEVVEAHQRQVYGLALRLTKREDMAEDLTQETFVAAWKARDRYKGTGSMQAWIMRIAINKVRSYWRWKKLRNWLSLDAEGEGGEKTGHNVPDPSREADPSKSASDQGLAVMIREALGGLTERQREAVVLRAQGLSVEETASAMGVKEGTVKATFFQARQKLQERLKEAL